MQIPDTFFLIFCFNLFYIGLCILSLGSSCYPTLLPVRKLIHNVQETPFFKLLQLQWNRQMTKQTLEKSISALNVKIKS